jgi:hypothetical protein
MCRVRRRQTSHCIAEPAVAALDLEATIAAELASHRPELEQLVRERLQFALAELTRELVAADLNERSNGTPGPTKLKETAP